MLGAWIEDEYIVAFKYMPLATSDKDYTDFIIMVESIGSVSN